MPALTAMNLPPKQIRRKCLQLVIDAAARHDVPPAYIVAHIASKRVHRARLEVMRGMFKLGLKRCQIAAAFNRDLRQVRRSVIGPEGAPARQNMRPVLVF